jgi:hypothetical protein
MSSPSIILVNRYQSSFNFLKGGLWLRPRDWVRSVNNGIVMQPFDIDAGDRAPLDEADCKLSAKFSNTSTRHRRTCAGRLRAAYHRPRQKQTMCRTNPISPERRLCVTSTKGQAAPLMSPRIYWPPSYVWRGRCAHSGRLPSSAEFR